MSAEFPFGDPQLQFRMRRTLRRLLARARREEPQALAFIMIGIPRDRAARVAHTLPGADDCYELMRAMLKQHDAGDVDKVSHDHIPEE